MKRILDRYEPDNWTTDGAKILSIENRQKIEAALSKGPIVVQHWYYRGASCPRVFGFDDLEEFELHLKENAIPGDAFDIWSFSEVCTHDSCLAEGKLPDKDGCVPSGGAY